MTVGELQDRMSSLEFIEWIAHDSLTAWERKHDADQRKNVMKLK